MKILQYIHLHIKNSITQITHYNTFHFLRYVQFKYANYLLINIQKQQNMLLSSLLSEKKVLTAEFLGFRMQNFQYIIFYMNTNIQRDFQICISVPLILLHMVLKIARLAISIKLILYQGFIQADGLGSSVF